MGGNQCHKIEFKKKRMKTSDNSIRDIWDNIKYTNIWVLDEEETEKGP